MHTLTLTLLAALASAASLPALASADLAKQHNCLSCHSVDKKVVGPSYKDIAAKYKGQSVEAALIDKIKHGSKGVYGPIPMPANANVPDADVKTLVKWILAQ